MCDARLTPGSGVICEAIHPFGVEAVDTLSYGLRVTAEFFGDLGGTQSLPAQGDDAGTEDPVTRSAAAAGELADLPFFFDVFRRSGAEQLGHGPLLPQSVIRAHTYVYRL